MEPGMVAEPNRARAYLSGYTQRPSTLYHYTNGTGLLGILRDREIWATHTQYLNDQAEFRHALGVMKEVIGDEASKASAGDDLLQRLEQGLSNAEMANVCVASFSEAPDSLSQWRAYGAPSSSYALGFSAERLGNVALAEGFQLAPCIYEPRDQRELMKRVLLDAVEDCREGVWGPLAAGRLVSALYLYAPVVKHRSFQEEQEWRIISLALEPIDARFDYRAGTSTLIPYYKIPLADTPDGPVVSKVVVGPTPRKTQARRAVQGLLAHKGYRNVAVMNTDTPFRAW